MGRLQPLRLRGRYVNPTRPKTPKAGEVPGGNDFAAFLRWRRERQRHPKEFDVPRAPAGASHPEAAREGVHATWIGHSSTLLQLDGRSYLLDPVWSERIGGVVKRMTAPGVDWKTLPRIDALVVSHNHLDHLDAPTVKRLPRETPVFCPVGVGEWFRRRGFRDVVERSWWEAAPSGEHKLTFVPAQHFSGRTLWDRDRSLWGGWVLQGDRGGSAYYAGDSGYFRGFREIGESFPGLDLAIIPVGAYVPRWFMAPVHVDPPEAGQAFLDVGARVMMPVHWGAFRMADEPIDEPPHALRAWWKEKGLPEERLRVPALGERITLRRAPADAAGTRRAEGIERLP